MNTREGILWMLQVSINKTNAQTRMAVAYHVCPGCQAVLAFLTENRSSQVDSGHHGL